MSVIISGARRKYLPQVAWVVLGATGIAAVREHADGRTGAAPAPRTWRWTSPTRCRRLCQPSARPISSPEPASAASPSPSAAASSFSCPSAILGPDDEFVGELRDLEPQ